jgi:hypothetical protein
VDRAVLERAGSRRHHRKGVPPEAVAAALWVVEGLAGPRRRTVAHRPRSDDLKPIPNANEAET